jgi:hypothetical protein
MTMKRLLTYLMVLATQLVLASNLMAATGLRDDTSMILVYLFLGMCALIVMVQLVPTFLLLIGLVKSVWSGKKNIVEAKVTSDE